MHVALAVRLKEMLRVILVAKLVTKSLESLSELVPTRVVGSYSPEVVSRRILDELIIASV